MHVCVEVHKENDWKAQNEQVHLFITDKRTSNTQRVSKRVNYLIVLKKDLRFSEAKKRNSAARVDARST